METREEFMLGAVREFVATLVALELLDSVMEGIKIARYNGGFTDALLVGAQRYEDHVNAKNRDKQPSIEYLMTREPDSDGIEMYRRTDAWLFEFSGGSVAAEGYFPDTRQAALRVRLLADKPLQEQLQILEFVPHIKPVGGLLRISVREPTLSQNGIFSLHIDPETGGAELIKTTYGRDSVVHAAPNLLACLEYVHVHHGNLD